MHQNKYQAPDLDEESHHDTIKKQNGAAQWFCKERERAKDREDDNCFDFFWQVYHFWISKFRL